MDNIDVVLFVPSRAKF